MTNTGVSLLQAIPMSLVTTQRKRYRHSQKQDIQINVYFVLYHNQLFI